ncbi:1-acylglycerol-3-phosphate O-acyltransferase [bacterium endosymbiont of Pedicinus badii]|uniref:1-acylglycerol-3-phosphate O-acyltransferase n=1 Tax=bacterium endosymbiont of Pedicinus badii TaxID=1719126 RepID=UPI0009B945CC|nr:1-acylglycerol-3-phosphate O-acyltransferase [bacterium endosymbiont of Pedicinus badii]OQM34167.1 acyl-phosphate glycerol 3-phosphate acyltransferase [bacterium endosymbiont of Pedicinus badii]
MIAFFRIFLILVIGIFVCFFGVVYCFCSKKKNYSHVRTFGRIFGKFSTLVGLSVEVKKTHFSFPKKCIYIANHQNNYDMFTVSNAIPKNTITVGKKSILFIPFFGILYWITGNLLIDRKNFFNSFNVIERIVEKVNKHICVLIFPEGTRSYSKKLLKFKKGAFYSAISAKVPIVPICSSSTYKQVDLNRFSNGKVIIEILNPIDTKNYKITQVNHLTKYCWNIMEKKIQSLNKEVKNK